MVVDLTSGGGSQMHGMKSPNMQLHYIPVASLLPQDQPLYGWPLD